MKYSCEWFLDALFYSSKWIKKSYASFLFLVADWIGIFFVFLQKGSISKGECLVLRQTPIIRPETPKYSIFLVVLLVRAKATML
jgi:hypothetical protein